VQKTQNYKSRGFLSDTSYIQAAEKLTYLLHRAFELGYSGVQLKDDFSPAAL